MSAMGAKASSLSRHLSSISGFHPALVGLVILLGLALLGPWLWQVSPVAQTAERFVHFSLEHPFGTDMFGRDLLARVLHGGRWSLGGAVAVSACATIVGFSVGAISALGPKWLDMLLSRSFEALLALPTLVVALAISAVLGMSFENLIIALVAAQWPWYARIFRMLVLREMGTQYVEAAHTLGLSRSTIVLRHIVPNILGPAGVIITGGLGGNILNLASLSFLGLGMQAPTPEWGLMINEARMYFQTQPLQMIVPGAAITITVLLANIAGDGLRDAVDPTTLGKT